MFCIILKILLQEVDDIKINLLLSRVCRKTLFSSDQFETPGELSLGIDY